MKTITRWNDLAAYGIDALTGEACGLSYRLLCDVTATGRAILEKLLSVPPLTLHPNWNRGSPDDPHIGSILLPPDFWVPLGIFALLESGCAEVWCAENRSLLGIEPTDASELIEAHRVLLGGTPVRRFAYRGTAGDRTVHVISGRIE